MLEVTPWAHQISAYNQAIKSDDGFAFFMDPGTGKTLITIMILRYHYNKVKKVLPTLIIAPVIVLENWKREFAKFSKIPEDKIIVLHGPVKKRMMNLAAARKKHGDGVIGITNYDVIFRPEYLEYLTSWKPTYLVLDESHKVKTYNSKRSKACHGLGMLAHQTYLLSGTPILNTPLDIFSQYLCLDKGKRFGKNFFQFRNQFFYDANAHMPRDRHFPNWQPRQDCFTEMNKLIYEVAIRAKKSECLDLPPLLKKRVYVSLSPTQRRLYDQMKKEFVTFLEESGEAVVAQLALTKTLRMRQIISGFVKTDEGKIRYLATKERDKTPRSKALEEILEEITGEHKVIVWSVFKAEYEIIRLVCKRLKLSYVEAHGEVSNKKKYEAVDLFNEDPTVRVFIGHPASLGIGINLTASSYSVYMSRDFSLEQRDQSEARNYRGGSEIHEKITHIDIVAEDTIDELILKALDDKANLAEVLLAWKEKL